jgi:hypothetical protein
MQRIIGAFTFRKEVYAEVEKDTSFTTTAWLLVAVVAFISNLGSAAATAGNVGGWILGAILGTVFAVIAFAAGAWVISWLGRALFQADVSFDELVRTLGLAYVWQIVGVLSLLGAISDALGCLVAPIIFISFLAMIAAWFIAAKEALDLEWGQTIVVVIVGGVAFIVVSMVIGGLVLGAVGVGAAVLGGLAGA